MIDFKKNSEGQQEKAPTVNGLFRNFVFVVGGGLVVLFVSICFYLWARYETKQRLDIGYGVTTDAGYARLQIGDKTFSIPKNHIWARADWKGGRVTGTNLQALLPDFEPFTETNHYEFEKPGRTRQISIQLSEHAMPADGPGVRHVSMNRWDVYKRVTHNQTARNVDGAFGLKRQEFPEPLSTKDEIFVGTKPNGSFYWVECSPDASVPFPSCSTHVEYSSHVFVKYSFSKERLSDWLKIEDGVLQLIKKFDDNPNEGARK